MILVFVCSGGHPGEYRFLKVEIELFFSNFMAADPEVRKRAPASRAERRSEAFSKQPIWRAPKLTLRRRE
jgi:hypothetical protein